MATASPERNALLSPALTYGSARWPPSLDQAVGACTMLDLETPTTSGV